MEYTSTILIAEDQKIFREAIVNELEMAGIGTLAQAANGEELLNLLRLNRPDVVLLDTEMPVLDGYRTLRVIASNFPDTKVIILSGHNDQATITDFLTHGAKGYLVKDVISGNIDLLIEAIERVKNGEESVIEVSATNAVLYNKERELTTAEKEGKTNEQLAAEMGIILKDSELGKLKPDDRNSVEKASGFFKHTFGKGLDFLLNDKTD